MYIRGAGAGAGAEMDAKKSNKIRDIVRLQQILKKWKRLANAPKPSGSSSSNVSKFLKRTLSFTEVNGSDVVRKGYVAVSVGKELKRFIIPTHYLTHQAFGVLLREAEEEFGFQHQGVLRIPCDVSVFENILTMLPRNDLQENEILGCCSPSASHHPQMCT